MAGAPGNVLNIPRPPVFATTAEERLYIANACAGRRIPSFFAFGIR